MSWKPIAIALIISLHAGCSSEEGDDDDDDVTDRKQTGEGPCDSPNECVGDVCVALIDGSNPPVYCTEECPCPSGFYCDRNTFALAGLEFCRFGGEPAQPEPPSEPPRLPCNSDADCDGTAVCATFQGERDCTILCSAEDQCTPPRIGGIVMDFYTCDADQTAGADRTVCLPDLACYTNPLPCIDGLGF